MSNSSNRIRREVSKSGISVSRVFTSNYQKEGTQTAELRQTVTVRSFYPTKSIRNSLQDNIFGMKDFGFEESEYVNKETRVTWIDVPVGTTTEQVAAKLAAYPAAVLYRITSNKPILSDTEQYAVNSPELAVSIDTFANRQAIRYPAGHEKEGQLALSRNDNKIQYRRIAFSTSNVEDKDLRNSDPEDFYVSPELEAELNNKTVVIEGQSI